MNKRNITMATFFRDQDTGKVETFEVWVKQKGVKNTNHLISFGFFVEVEKDANGEWRKV